jgi:homoserine dehydrogenase
LSVADQPGALAAVANVFSTHGVSVELVEQGVLGTEAVQEAEETTATLVIGTHAALESDLASTVKALSQLDAVRSVVSVLRIEGA